MKKLTPIVLAIIIVSFGFVGFVKANPSYFMRCNNSACPTTSVATTTVSYMTAGTATTTVSFDTGRSAAGSVDSAVLLTQFTASSTSSVLNINLQYSQDGVDWYSDNLYTNVNATTTQQFSISTANSVAWTASTSGRQLKAIVVRTPTRYVRAVFSLPVGSAAGAVWAEFVAKQQTP